MSAFEGAALVVAVVALGVRMAGRQHRLLHLLQLEHYEEARLMLWLRRRGELYEARELVSLGGLYAAACADAAVGGDWLAGALLLASVPVGALGIHDWRREAVKPLVLTARARRLLTAALVPQALLTLAALVLAITGVAAAGMGAVLALGVLSLLLAPWTLCASNRALAPWQRRINGRYLERARRSLRESSPLVVGVTGSYGKTTTKFCLGSVLSEDRPTLVTPESYNSLLGVTRTVNELLRPDHEAFVVEMGMFRRGDIAELCELVVPTIGVITAIGPMHMERLGSIEQIAAAKAELLEALPPDGRFVTNGDDPRCLELAQRAHVPVTLFGVDLATSPPDGVDVEVSRSPGVALQVLARAIRMEDGRTMFDLCLDGPDSPALPVSSELLGTHNVLNQLAAAAVGRVLELDPGRIVRGLERVRAPAHRLAPIHNRPARIVVIDDAYNSNPDGARAALEVLAQHPAERRLLVTPGMVELGEVEEQLNRTFGEQAGAVCDLAVLVGPTRTQPIREGLVAVGMAERDIHVVRDISEATALLGRLTRAGDVVLFENDLPDTYAESDGAVRAGV
jgi:UDP-N-acetylmuramoyl-tripeptide--D-alanyl-D-alanine ligase